MSGNKTESFQQTNVNFSQTGNGVVSRTPSHNVDSAESLCPKQEFICPISLEEIDHETLPVYFYSQVAFAAEKITELLNNATDLPEHDKETLKEFSLDEFKNIKSLNEGRAELVLENLSDCMEILRERPEFKDSSAFRVFNGDYAKEYLKIYSNKDIDPFNRPLSNIKILFKDPQIARIITLKKNPILDALFSNKPIENFKRAIAKDSNDDIQSLLNSDKSIQRSLVKLIMREKNLDFLKFLVEKGFPLNTPINRYKQNLLHWAILEDNKPFIDYLRKGKYLDLNNFLNIAPVKKIILATISEEMEIKEEQFNEPAFYVLKIEGNPTNRKIQVIWKMNGGKIDRRFFNEELIGELNLPKIPDLNHPHHITINTPTQNDLLDSLKRKVYIYDLFYDRLTGEIPLQYAIRLKRKEAVRKLLSDHKKNVWPDPFENAIDSDEAEIFEMLINRPNNCLTDPFYFGLPEFVGESFFGKLFKRAEEKKSYNILLKMYAKFPEWCNETSKKTLGNILRDVQLKDLQSENLQQIFDSLCKENNPQAILKPEHIIALINTEINSENVIPNLSKDYQQLLKNIYDVLRNKSNVNNSPVFTEFLLKYDNQWNYSPQSFVLQFFGWKKPRWEGQQSPTKYLRRENSDDVTNVRERIRMSAKAP